MTRWLVVAALVIGAACGGGSNTFASRSAQTVADKMGCSDLELSKDPKLLTREHGTCELGSDSVEIHTYSNDKTQERVDDFAADAGLSTGVYVEGDGWIVFCTAEATCKRVQDRLGGKLR